MSDPRSAVGANGVVHNDPIHAFWDTQPVPKLHDTFTDGTDQHGPIDAPKTVDEVRATPYALPDAYEWYDVDMTDEAEVDQVYDLLTKNYVEDTDAMFRFDYSRDFLRWALMPPGFRRDWHSAVRIKTSGKLVAFISAVPARVRVHDHAVVMVEINYLCVHKKLRSRRLAPVLIREITRRVNRTGVWQAAYTAGALLPKPVARNRYFHRSLNPKKLVEVGFSQLPRRMTLKMLLRLYSLDTQPSISGLRPMQARDVPGARRLLSQYASRFKLSPDMDDAEFAHWFLPRPDVVYAYVVVDDAGSVTDLISFYCLPSTILNHAQHRTLRAAFSFYNVATSVPWSVLMKDALILANNNAFDVFNALNVMDNGQFFEALKFGIGDGNLHYYLYNWRCPEIASHDVALVLM